MAGIHAGNLNTLMHFTEHFQQRRRQREPYIETHWCESVINNLVMRETQPDGRVRFWGLIPWPDAEHPHYLRVVTLADERTIMTAFIDSGFQRRLRRSQQ